ncbi:MAG: hypothetical protein K2O09_04380 [Treponemataceae bacterium]|nr:hypothetical protein [Treponemataceae bacterium]
MKRLLLVAASMLCLIVCFFACSDLQNLSEPKKVVVKPGDAKYSIPFGGYSVAFDDYINVTKLQESLADASGDDVGLSVYDYQDPKAKNLQQFIVEYPIAGISLNPDDYLGDITDFLQNFKLSDDGDSQISIPINDVFKQVSESLADCSTQVEVPLETLNGTIGGYSKGGNRITGLTIRPVREEISPRQIGFDYGGNGFIKQAIIKSGTFTIDCELPHGWSGVTAKVELSVSGAIEGAQFKDAGKTAAFLIRQKADLSGKTINGKEKDLNITGAVTLEFNNATIVLNDDGRVPDLVLVCTSQIEKIRDAQIYLEEVINAGDFAYKDSIPVHIPEYVKNCKIVRLDMQTAIDTNLGGIIKNLYMAPKISSSYMNFDASGSYNDIFDNANGLRITKDVDEGWEGFYLVKDGTPPPQEKIDIAVDFDIRGDNYNPNSPDNYIAEEDTITITEFDLTKASDTEYYLKPTFAAPEYSTMFECDDLELQIDENNAPFAGSIETGLSIGDMLGDLVDSGDNSALGNFVEDLIEAIELQGIEGYLYVTAPKTDGEGIDFADLLSPVAGYVKASYEGSDPEILIGNGTKDDPEKIELEIKNNVPSFASLADENRLITDDSIFSEKYYSAKTKEGSLTNIINQKANNLKFDYDISFGDSKSGTISLGRNQIRPLQNAAKVAGANVEIAMTIAVVLPLRLNITKDIRNINIMALAGDGEDVDFLGGEDSDSDFSEYTDYTKALKSLELWYQFKNPLGLKIDALFSEKNEFISQKPMHFDNEKHSISLKTKEIDKILTASSFIPRISMTLEKGEVSVTRNAELKMNAALVIKTDNDAGIEFEL